MCIISFLFEKEDSGKTALTLIYFFFLILEIFSIILCFKSSSFSFLVNGYGYFTIFDITPISSIILSSFKITFSYFFLENNISSNSVKKGNITIHRPRDCLITSLITQSINILLYLGLLILIESGIIKKLFNKFKVKFLIKDSYTFLFPEQISIKLTEDNNINQTINEKKVHLLSNNENISTSNKKEDSVQEQIKKVKTDEDNDLTTKIIGLKKTYWICCKKNVRAVNNLYLGLENNEKFGLLGFNGSGKTTTFKCITKEILYDTGSIFLLGDNIEKKFSSIRYNIGYCPQENPLFDYMKVKEVISFYLSLKKINQPLSKILEKFDLTKYKDTMCINLSGGNKRKLSFAIALLNYPKILLLDEPSTGVDPESRRVMWKNIINLTKKNNNFNMILSTHSMEEAEVLCDTVSWLKSGNLLSIGNPEKLKIMLSAGYKLHIKFSLLDDNENIDLDVDNLNRIVKNFDLQKEFIEKNNNIRPYIKELNKIINKIKDKCSEIEIIKINKDFSFEFNIHVIKEKQKELFTHVLNMKNDNQKLSEISISMESLENILTNI